MGVTWRYFKHYKIIKDEDSTSDYMIQYIDGGKLKLTYLMSGKLREVFSNYTIHIPIYCELEPPTSRELELISPRKIIQVCEKVIKILKEELNNGFVESNDDQTLLLWNQENLQSCGFDNANDLNERFIGHLERIRMFSKQGYFIVEDFD